MTVAASGDTEAILYLSIYHGGALHRDRPSIEFVSYTRLSNSHVDEIRRKARVDWVVLMGRGAGCAVGNGLCRLQDAGRNLPACHGTAQLVRS